MSGGLKRFRCWTLKNFGEFIKNTDWQSTHNFYLNNTTNNTTNNTMNTIIQTRGNMLSRYDASEHHSGGADEKFPITVRSLFVSHDSCRQHGRMQWFFDLLTTCLSTWRSRHLYRFNVVLIFISSFLDSYLRFFKILALTMWFLGHQMELLLLFVIRRVSKSRSYHYISRTVSTFEAFFARWESMNTFQRALMCIVFC